MNSVLLNDRQTTVLGFGGSLLGSTPPEKSRQLLRAAFDGGIRHFDVAPMYGFGQAERLLREALGTNLREVTVTTKYGLLPPLPESPLRRLARRALQPFPALQKRLRRTADAHEDEPMEDRFQPLLTGEQAQRSIDDSLRNLGVDALDLLLLHEATPFRLGDPGLLETLQRNEDAGKIRAFGVGSRSVRVVACMREKPEFCRFLQYEWSVFSPPLPSLEACPHIVHGSLGGGRTASPADLERWSHAVNLDLRSPGMLARLFIKASLVHHRGHTVLFSTRSLKNLRSNIRTAEDASLERPAHALRALLSQAL